MLNDKKKIYIIGTVGVPACYGGFESLVDNLLGYTPGDVEYTVFCSAKKYEKHLASYKGARLVYLDRDANGGDSILYDYESMKIAVKENADIMLVLGVSGCIFLPKIRRAFKGKIITNIDGLEWKRDKWSFFAKRLLHFSEKQAVRYSDVIIGDNKGITEYIHKAYKKVIAKKCIELIAYGGDHVSFVKDDAVFEKYPFCRESYAVTVCRIEPENNVHVILKAFTQMSERVMIQHDGGTGNTRKFTLARHLVIVGNWEKSEYSRALKAKYSETQNIHLLAVIYEGHEINWLRSNAAVYIHGHSAGGTNPSLVEAMNLGLPILAFDCVYNRATTEEKALYWKNADELTALMRNHCGEFDSIAHDMREAGKRLYSWERIAAKYNSLY